MNQDINLTELIERDEKNFLSSFENKEHFITENTRTHSGNGSFYIASFTLSLVFSLFLASPMFFFRDFFDNHSLLPTVFGLFGIAFYFSFFAYLILKEENILKFRFKRMFKKMSAKDIYKHVKEYHLVNFYDSPISDEIHNAVKIDFSMDEYKHLLSQGKNNNDISYGQLLNFIEKREHYKKERQAIEQSKNSVHLSPSEIKAYQMEHLS